MSAFSRIKDRVERFGKRSRKQLSSLDDVLKRLGRKAAVPLAKAQPYVTGGVTAALSFAAPGLGTALAALYGTAESAIAPWLGATAARQKGESGGDARDAGRDQRKKVATGAGVGIGVGTVGAFVQYLLTPAAAPAAPAAAPGATLPATVIGPGGLPIPTGALTGTASLESLTALSPFAAEGGGILGTLGSIGKTLLGAAPAVLSAYDKLNPKLPGTFPDFGDLLGLAGLAGGAEGGGAGLGAAEAGGSEGPTAGPGLPTWVKVAGGGAVLLSAYGLYRVARKGKAA